MVNDMTVGSPSKLILKFSIPLLIGNIFQQFYSMVDAIIVGRFIGTEALASVGVTGSIVFLVMGFVMGITSGFAVLVAQFFGAGDYKHMRQCISVATYMCVGFTILITIVTVIAARPLLLMMKTPDDIIDGACSYITIIYAGTAATMAYNMLAGILRALGDSKTPLYFLIVSSVLNVILDFLFILAFNSGVAGAAYATVISQAITSILCYIYIKKHYDILKIEDDKERKFSFSIAKKELTVGLPMAFQFSITAIGVMVLQSAINTFGSTTVAAYTAASKVEQIATQPMATLGVAMATYTGQNLGAGKIERIKEGVKKCILIAIGFGIIGAILILTCGEPFVQLFLDGEQPLVMAAAKQYLNIICPFFIILGLLFIYRNTLQGLGDGFVPMMAGVAELVARVVVALVLAKLWGYTGICLAGPLAWAAAAIPLAIVFYIRMKKLNIVRH